VAAGIVVRPAILVAEATAAGRVPLPATVVVAVLRTARRVTEAAAMVAAVMVEGTAAVAVDIHPAVVVAVDIHPVAAGVGAIRPAVITRHGCCEIMKAVQTRQDRQLCGNEVKGRGEEKGVPSRGPLFFIFET
jgi:hypothetical protein